MALVTCPKCGGQISDTAGECVHCGFAFKICPDCGAVLAKDAEKCEQCGYAFREAGATSEAPAEMPSESGAPKSDGMKDHINEWEKSG